MTTQPMATCEGQIGSQANDTFAVHTEVDQCVSERLRQCPYAFYFNRVSWTFGNEILTLSGCVPTLNLKGDLEKRLAGVQHVERIVVDVDVICADGMSYLHPR
jgi:hypothetical protein